MSSILFDQSLQVSDPLKFRQGQTDLDTFLHFGGYPELVDQRQEEKRELLRDYRNTYLQRDILELSNIHDLNAFRALVAALAQSSRKHRQLSALSEREWIESCHR